MMSNGDYTILPEADFVTDDPSSGSAISVTVSNAISFPNYFTSFFGDQMWIYAQVATPDANYEIDMYDDSANYLGSFTGSADSNGLISFIWDLTDGNGNTYTNAAFSGVFNAASSKATQTWTKNVPGL